MQKSVKMFTRLAGTDIPIGQCHPAEARVLVKKDLAAWQDGNLQVILRPAFVDLLDSNEHAWKGPLDDGNVSQAELDRRMAWFKQFVELGVQALHGVKAKPGDVAPSQFEEIHRAAQNWITAALEKGDRLDSDLPDDEKDLFFSPKAEESLEALPGELWKDDIPAQFHGNPEDFKRYLGIREDGVAESFTVRHPNWMPALQNWGEGGAEGIEVLERVFCKIH